MAPLFELPEYDAVFAAFVARAVEELAAAGHPTLSQIRRVEVPSLRVFQATIGSGKVVTQPPVKIEMRFSVPDAAIRETDIDELLVVMLSAAEQQASQMMRAFYDLLGRVTLATGNVVDAGGDLSFEHVIQVFEKIELSFGDDGRPIMPTIHLHPDDADKVREAFERATPEQTARLEAIIDRKRRQYDARRRTRRLR